MVPSLMHVTESQSLRVFSGLSRSVGHLMTRLAQTRDSFREETITDIALMVLAEAKLQSVATYKATPAEEGSGGFDWEWFIGSDSHGWWRYAVQAKKLARDGKYRELRHKVKGSGKFQIDLLREYSSKYHAIPIYAFYNHALTPHTDNHWNCPLDFEPDQLGVSIAALDAVAKAHEPRQAKTFKALHREHKAIPLRCLVGCPSFSNEYKRHNIMDPTIRAGVIPQSADKFANLSSPVRHPVSGETAPTLTLRHRSLPLHILEARDGSTYSQDNFETEAFPFRTLVIRLSPDL